MLRGRVTIAESATEVGGKMVFTTPKTYAIRTISIPRSVADLLSIELVGKGPDDRVFERPRGGVLREGNFRRDVFDDAAAEVGLKGLTPHALRHTAASLAISACAHVVAVAVYSHLFPNDLDDVAARLEEAAANIGGTNRD